MHASKTAGIQFALVALLCALSACAHVQRVPAEPIDPAQHAASLQERALASPDVQEGLDRFGLSRPVADAWSLDQLTVAAWTLNPDVAVAMAQLDAARAATAVARLPPNPTLNINLERVISQASSTPWVLGAGLGLLLQTGGKLDIRRERAEIQERVVQAQLGATLWTICYGLRRAAMERTLAAGILSLDREETGLRQAYLDWIQTRLDLGAATSQDILQAREALQASESRQSIDQTAFIAASVQLAALVGIAPGDLPGIVIATSLIETLPADLAAVIDDIGQARDLALVNRLDIRRALAEYDIAEQDLRESLAGQYPDVGLGPGYLFDQGAHKLSLNTSIPLALHGTNQARIDQAVANRTVVARRFDQVQASAMQAIDGRHAMVVTWRNSFEASELVEAVAQSAVQAVQQRLAAGGANRGDLLGAQLLLLQRQRDVLMARQMLFLAVSDLEDAIQKPIFPASALTFHEASLSPGPDL